MLPGNHDRYRSLGRHYRPGGVVFDGVFCPKNGRQFWRAGQGIERGVALQKGTAVVHIVKADFTLHRGDHGRPFFWLPGWFGQGRVRQTVLDELVDVSKRLRHDIEQDGYIPITLWAIHFDPTTTDQTLILLEWERLAEAAKTVPVTAILCGHTHETKVKAIASGTSVFACGTTAQAASPFWDCQIIELETADLGGALVAVRVHWYRYDRGQFRFLATR